MHMWQVKALYMRMDAAIFYCATKSMSFGLHAYVATVSQMQRTTKSIWGDLEAEGMVAKLRDLVIDHLLESRGSTAQRHFVVTQQKNLGSRGEVMAVGSREEARKCLAVERKAVLLKAVRKAKGDLARAEAALLAFEEQAGTSDSTSRAVHPPAAGTAARASKSGAATSRASRKRSERDSCSESEEDEDDEDDEEEGGGSNAQRKRSCPRRQASVEAQARETFAEMDDEED
jgi:hypothetical protein